MEPVQSNTTEPSSSTATWYDLPHEILQQIFFSLSLKEQLSALLVEKKIGPIINEGYEEKLRRQFPKAYYKAHQEWDGLQPINYIKMFTEQEKNKYGEYKYNRNFFRLAEKNDPQVIKDYLSAEKNRESVWEDTINGKNAIAHWYKQQPHLLDFVYKEIIPLVYPPEKNVKKTFKAALECKQPRAELERLWAQLEAPDPKKFVEKVFISDNVEGLQLLVAKGLDIKFTTKYLKKSLLHLAAESNAVRITEWLLAQPGIPLDLPPLSVTRTELGIVFNPTPLLYAVYYQHTEITRMLLQKGAEPNKQYEVENDSFSVTMSLLHILFRKEEYVDPELIRLLLDHNVDLMIKTSFTPNRPIFDSTFQEDKFSSKNTTAVSWAVKRQSLLVVSTLIEHPACKPVIEQYTTELWHLAGTRKQADVARYLYTKLPLKDIAVKDSQGETILDKAVNTLSVDVVKFLLEINFDITKSSVAELYDMDFTECLTKSQGKQLTVILKLIQAYAMKPETILRAWNANPEKKKALPMPVALQVQANQALPVVEIQSVGEAAKQLDASSQNKRKNKCPIL